MKLKKLSYLYIFNESKSFSVIYIYLTQHIIYISSIICNKINQPITDLYKYIYISHFDKVDLDIGI